MRIRNLQSRQDGLGVSATRPLRTGRPPGVRRFMFHHHPARPDFRLLPAPCHDIATDSTDQVYGWLGEESPSDGILRVSRMLPPRHALQDQHNIVRAVP
jgi:hypothetical protein